MSKDSSEIGKRLREFGLSKFTSMAEFARALDLPPQSLNSYLSGNFMPGNKMQSKLRELGCDIEWLMTGKKGAEGKGKKPEAIVAFHAPDGIDPEVKKVIQKMIDDLSEMEYGDVERAREIVRAAFKKKK